MEKESLSCAAMPLRADQSIYALVLGSREGMKSLLGSRYDQLQRRIDPLEWALRPEVQCLIGDEGADVFSAADDFEKTATLPGWAVRLLYARWQAGLSGWTLLPCADVEHNGEYLKEAMIARAVEWKLPAAFLRWLVAENTCCATMTDCAEWLIETASDLPVPQAEGAVRYVKSLANYRQRRQRMLGGAGVLAAAAGCLCGLETVGAAMREEGIRKLLGNMLVQEMIPCLPMREEGLAYAARVCAYLENACGEEAWPGMGEGLVRRWMACILPAVDAYVRQEGVLPDCLCFSLSALIMLYAGVRRKPEGDYALPGEQGDLPVLDAETALAAFSRMSCDMPPESLAYAALSDREIWGCDLREIDGLEEKITGQLRDMQILGARAAMLRAAEAQA